MPLKSSFPNLIIPQQNLITYLCPDDRSASTNPHWIDVKSPSSSLSLAEALIWAKRLAAALDHAQIPRQAVVLLVSPNSILIPALFYGIVGSGRIFR